MYAIAVAVAVAIFGRVAVTHARAVPGRIPAADIRTIHLRRGRPLDLRRDLLLALVAARQAYLHPAQAHKSHLGFEAEKVVCLGSSSLT